MLLSQTIAPEFIEKLAVITGFSTVFIGMKDEPEVTVCRLPLYTEWDYCFDYEYYVITINATVTDT